VRRRQLINATDYQHLHDQLASVWMLLIRSGGWTIQDSILVYILLAPCVVVFSYTRGQPLYPSIYCLKPSYSSYRCKTAAAVDRLLPGAHDEVFVLGNQLLLVIISDL